MKKAVVLGAGGFIGSHLVKRLNDLGINSSGIEADKNQVSQDISGKLSHGYFDETFQNRTNPDLVRFRFSLRSLIKSLIM